MSVSALVHRRERAATETRALTVGESEQTGSLSIQEDKPPVVIRLEAVLNMLNNFVLENGDPSLARYVVIYQALTDEVIDELTERDDEAIGVFMEMMGDVISWIGHGDNDRLPDTVRDFAERLKPTPAIES